MSEFLEYNFYYLFALFSISIVAAGRVLAKTRSPEDALIFIAFITYSFAIFTTTFFGYSISTDEHGKVLSETEPLLSINQTLWLHLIAALSFSAGFVIKACTLTKKSRVHP